MGITRGAAGRSKPGFEEGSGLVLSSGSFEVNWVSNPEVVGTG